MRTEKANRFQALLVCIGMLAGILQGCAAKVPERSIKDYGEAVFGVYFMTSEPVLQENGKDYVNYWIASARAITLMYRENNYRKAAKIINCLMGTFSRNGYFPRADYKSYNTFEYGWASCLDAPPAAVAAQMLYEHTGKAKYKRFVSQLMEYIPTNVSEHGFIATANGKRWLFEYAETDTDAENGAFVLNGSMVGTLSTCILASYFSDEGLRQLVTESTENYKAMMENYLYDNNEWCYYMLNRKTVNQPHYVLFEIRLCEALYALTQDTFYQEQAELRRSMLLRWYKAYVYQDKTDGRTYVTMLRGGAPHYYNNDLYATRLELYDEGGELLKSEVMSGREREYGVIRVEMPENASKTVWLVDRYPDVPLFSVCLGELQLEEGYPVNPSDHILDTVLNANADGAFSEDGELVLTNKTGTANVVGTFSAPASGDPETVFVIEFENYSPCECSMNLVLYDQTGLGISRTLLPLQYGKCYAAFSVLGFVQKETSLCDVASFNLRLYTNSIPDDTEYSLRIKNIYAFQNTWEYLQYMEQSEYLPLWRE